MTLFAETDDRKLSERAQRVAERLETAIARCTERNQRLQTESLALDEQMHHLRVERAQLREKTDEARHRVESMIARLRNMGAAT
ncbi:MAG: DUF904 domain-containing protein [Thioalkalivibrionaceae bacterium]